MLSASNIVYEMAERAQGMNCGGIGAMHLMVQRLGLVEDLDQNLELLKVHLPYHESDHVLNIAYNIVAGGERLEDIELRRQDEVFLMDWERNGYPIRRRPEISRGALVSRTLWRCRNASIERGSKYGKYSRRDF